MEKGRGNPPPYQGEPSQQQSYPVQPYPVQSYPVQQQYPVQGAPQQQYQGTQPPQQVYYPPPQQQTLVYETNNSAGMETMKKSIPSLPMCMAIFCLIVNCILPGLGSVIASFGCLCCADTRNVETGKCGLFCINFWIGWSQLITAVFGIGWIWSIFWGFLFVHNAQGNQEAEEPEITVITQPLQQQQQQPYSKDIQLPQQHATGQDNGAFTQ